MENSKDVREYISELAYKVHSDKVLRRVWKILEREYAQQEVDEA